MQLQNNPYLIWQIIPALVSIWLGVYVQSRPRKKPESNVFSLLLFAGAYWSLANAIQLTSPAVAWQSLWHLAAFPATAIIPTAWLILAVRLTGYFQKQVEKAQPLLLVIPALTLATALTNPYHHGLFSNYRVITIQGFTTLTMDLGVLFTIHTLYSYLLLLAGMVFLGIALVRNFKKYGTQAYGLILGVLAPLIGNILYLVRVFPEGFPDPTPMSFSITAITFAWAIFAGRMLDVVPIAHEAVVTQLTYGVVVLDGAGKILDINPAAQTILGLPLTRLPDLPLVQLLEHDRGLAEAIGTCLAKPIPLNQDISMTTQGGKSSYELKISGVQDKQGRMIGRMLQFIDISRQRQVEKNLAATKESLTSMLDTLKEYYFETDVNGVVTNINKAFYEHLGYSRKEDILGKHFRHFTDRESTRLVFQNFIKVIETKKTVELFRYSYHTKDGKAHIGETTVSPILEGDLVVGARGVLRDVTDRVKAEEVLRQSKANVEAYAEELAAINRIAALGSQSLNLNTILQALCVELTHIYPVRNTGIGLLSNGKRSLEVVAFHTTDPEEESALGMTIPFEGNPVFQEVIEKRTTIIIQDCQNDPRTQWMAGLSRWREAKAIMIMPLLTRGNGIGAILMPARDPGHVFDRKEIKLAEIIAGQIAAAIDNAQLHAQTESALGVAERDLEIGRQIQAGFFPEKIPVIPGWEMAAHFEAARQVAGDFYDFYRLENSNMTALVIADVCDKGVGAALFMVLFRSLLRAYSKSNMDSGNAEEQLKSIIFNTNNYIARVHANSSMFATFFFGVLDPESGSLYYVNGGHEPPAILDKTGKIIRRLSPTGPAIGLFPDCDYRVEQVRFDPGDFLVGFTDGTTDAQSKEELSFSEERLLRYIQAPWTSLFSMIYELKGELNNFMGGQKQFDDITLISIRRKLTPDCEQHAICRVADNSALGELRDFVDSVTRQCELDDDNAQAFKLAAEGACKNILQHGFEGGEIGLISLFFESDTRKARLIIRDNGKYLPAGQKEILNLDTGEAQNKKDSPDQFSIRQLMDNSSYTRMQENGNQLILEKDFHHRVPVGK